MVLLFSMPDIRKLYSIEIFKMKDSILSVKPNNKKSKLRM